MSLQFGLVFYWRGRKNLFTCKHLTSSFIDMVMSFCQLIVNRNYCIQRKITCWCTQYVLFTPHSSTVTCFLSFENFRIRGPVCPAQHLSKCGKELGPFSHVLEVRGAPKWVSWHSAWVYPSFLGSSRNWFLIAFCCSLSLLTLCWLNLVLTLPVLPAHVTFSNHGSLRFLSGFLSVEIDGTLLQ